MTQREQINMSRRGLGTGGLIAIIAGAVVVLGIGVAIGRATSTRAIVESPPPGPAETSVVAQTTPGTPGTAGTPGTTTTAARPGAAADEKPAIANAADLPPDAPFGFDPPALKFGLVAMNKELQGSFTVTNQSKRELHLLAMKPDCKCTTVADLAGTRIAPGDSVVIEPVIDARSYPGKANSEIVFLFEGYDPVRYQISSDVSRAVRTEPSFLQVDYDSALAGVVTVESIDDRPFRILAVDQGEVPYADSFDPKTDAPRNSYLLAWDMSIYDSKDCTDANGRRMPRYWVIETDHPEAPLVDLRVRNLNCTLPEGFGRRQWMLSEQRVVLDDIPAGESREFTVDLKWRRNSKPSDTIGRVESLSEAFAASLLPLEVAGDEITCRVRVTPRSDYRGLIYGEVRFEALTTGLTQDLIVIARVVDPVPTTASVGRP